jgi:CSLREA domain-containing protein
MKEALNKKGGNRKGKKVGLWAISLIVSFQVLGWVLFSMVTSGLVEAKTFTVTSTLDETDTSPGDGVCLSVSGYCTLRAAIQEANDLFGPDTIKLKTGNYMLTIPGRLEIGCATGDLDIHDDLTITGTNATKTFINGNQLDRVFQIHGNNSVSIAKVTIQNGLATDDDYTIGDYALGGAILIDGGGTLKVTACTLSNNAALGNYTWGGAIYNLGSTIVITGSTLSNNLARGINEGQGGAIWDMSGSLTITGSTLSMNTASGVGADSYARGGAILSSNSSLAITKSTISNNVSGGLKMGEGGGIWNYGTLMATITGSTISNNVSGGPLDGYGGGIMNHGQLTVVGSTLSDNSVLGMGGASDGGGIKNYGQLAVTGSTFSKNTALGPYAYGGGISNMSGQSTVTRSTLSNNTALGLGGDGAGGGIYAQSSTLIVTGSTINNNTASGCDGSWGGVGGGIFGYLSDVTVDSSTLSGNAATGMTILGYGGGICHIGGIDDTLTVQNKSKIIKNLTSNYGGGIFLIYGSISPDCTVAGNMPDDIFYD